jgi:menaquinone-dependent protoporphyrinogen IX oxidase
MSNTQETKYPFIKVQLSGKDGNAFEIMSSVTSALRKAGVSSDDVQDYTKESMSGDYDNVLRTAMRWVSVS